ncbi:hypothetical protein IC582_023606 [Cucumis melo]
MDRNGQISNEETKEVMNLIDELVATQNTTNAFGEEDILIRALGGKDRQGILHGVGKYVTKKKYFHTATQQKTNEKEDEKVISKEHDRMAKRIKVLEEELLKMKEKDDCVGDLKEESGMGSKEKSSMDEAENVKDLNEDVKSLKDFTSMRPIATACLDAYIMNHWILVVINLTKGVAFWIDPLKNRIDLDVTEVVERSFNIMNKKKPNWRVVKMKDSPRTYTQDDIDCIRFEWAEFVGKHVRCAYDKIFCHTFCHIFCHILCHIFFPIFFVFELPWKIQCWRKIQLPCSISMSVLLMCVVDHEVLLNVVDHEVLLKCVVDKIVLLKCVVHHEVLLKCVVHHEVLLKCVVDKKVLLKCVVDYEVLLKCFVDHEVLLKCCVVRHEVNVMCLFG